MKPLRYFSIIAISSLALAQAVYCSENTGISAAERPFLEGRYERSIQEAERLINASSEKRDELYYIKGLSELKLNRFADARESFGYIVSNYPKSKRLFDAHIGIGDTYLLEGNKTAASSIYSGLLEKFPNDPNIDVVRSRIKDCGSVRPAVVSMPSFVREKPVVQASASVHEPEPVSARQESIRTESEGLCVQVGSFKNKRNADNLSKKLGREGYRSYVEAPGAGADKMYRVKIRCAGSRDDAERTASRLKVKGYPTRICEAN